ncbi:hypothetical protein TNCV_938171 [Trichonephila clavipes]|nr:hypothetical protein TNCV_938171 [Trichonephila clavipes]
MILDVLGLRTEELVSDEKRENKLPPGLSPPTTESKKGGSVPVSGKAQLGVHCELTVISTSSAQAILYDHAQKGFEICSQASVGGTEKLDFTFAQDWTLSTLNLASCDFWLFPKMKMSLKGSRFQSTSRDKAERDGRVEHQSKRSLPEKVSAVERMLV